MCFAEDSVEYATATCAMCAVMREVYNKPHTLCPHVPAMGVCRNRTNHPKADMVYYRNAEIKTYNGCGYCKWADRHPDLSPRERYDNPGWPGCCRPPSASEYMQYIDPADWPAVSHIHKLNRVASDDGTLLNIMTGTIVASTIGPSTTAPILQGVLGAPKQAQADQSRVRHSPRAKSAITWPTPPSSKRDPIARSGSPLLSGVRRERPNTPPSSIRKQPGSQNVSKNPADVPITPTRHIKEPIPSRRSGAVESFLVDKAIMPPRPRSSPVEAEYSTPRRTTIAIQSQSTFWPKQLEESSSGRNRSIPRPSASPRSTEGLILPSDPRRRDRNATPPAIVTPPTAIPLDDAMLVADRGNLSSEALARVHTLHRAMHGLTLTSSVPSIFPSASMSTSSSSSSSSGGSGSATSTSSRHDGSTTTTGGSSDFTDFLSDDSDYELQRQAEERAAQLQRARFERQDEREFRDAQQSLAAVGLTESMGLQTPPATSSRSISRQVPQIHVRAHSPGGSSMPGSRGPPTIPPTESFQTVYVGRY